MSYLGMQRLDLPVSSAAVLDATLQHRDACSRLTGFMVYTLMMG
jgi:hypothetical protein